MLDGARVSVLRRRRPSCRQQGFAGRIRYQMQVKELLGLVHSVDASPVDGCGKDGRSGPFSRQPCMTAGFIHKVWCCARESYGTTYCGEEGELSHPSPQARFGAGVVNDLLIFTIP